jgi:hypothetical protein
MARPTTGDSENSSSTVTQPHPPVNSAHTIKPFHVLGDLCAMPSSFLTNAAQAAWHFNYIAKWPNRDL